MQTFAALAEPNRRRIVELLARRDYAAGDLVERLALSQPAVSQHLRALREAKLVTVRPEGQRRIYALDPRGLAELDAWLARYRKFWNARLGALERALSEE